MGRFDGFFQRWSPVVLSIMRIMAAGLFLEHGAQKLFGFPPGMGPVPWMSFMGFTGALEFTGGVLLLLGAVRPPGGVHPRRRDGGGLLHGPCAPRFLPDGE